MLTVITDPKAARPWVKAAGERSPVLAEVELHVFRGATLYVEHEGDQPLSYNVTRFGKRKKNVWEPYANWYTAYTVERFRRRGHARRLARHVATEARRAGCARLKAKAGTWAGLMLHYALGDQLWGMTEELEVIVDTPLVRAAGLAGRAPPNATADAGTEPWKLSRVVAALAGRRLRYEPKEKPPAGTGGVGGLYGG